MNVERGFRRVTWIVSAVVFLAVTFLGLVIAGHSFSGVVGALGAAVALGAVPWGIFYLIRWVIQGFKGDPSIGV